ncbi:MFS transporter [Micromonospora carbonacea]|uniref:MFS transporter n=1 Tax=Micromonospora carbonacea TaxID=47853 RepID=A0A7H8XMA7_9ACTN|nr:MFS transporter [Micromonospora carbonacea]MBB5826243.1 sugar phosphate permease [Micromonospora carbonacea]QLD25790.1 MFS transporter [Micromonospora carbonacea]
MADSRRWVMLGIGTAAQTAGTLYLYGLPFLLPALRRATGLPLWELGLLVACPSLGMVLALIGWGVVADRRGERLVIGLGLTGGAAFLAAAAHAAGPALFVLLTLAGAAGSAVYAASGRVVTGWFAPGERGLAMGIRQTSQPLGVAAASAALPVLADSGGGPRLALLAAAAVCALTGIVAALLLVDGPRPGTGVAPAAAGTGGAGSGGAGSGGTGTGGARVPSPYRSPTLWRVHGASALLVVAQFVVGAYALDYLVTERGWPVRTAGPLIAGAQLVAAATRVLAGRWSDRSSQRLRPLRIIAAGTAAALGALAVAEALHAPPAAPLLLVALVATVSWHGVAYAAVADVAPASWAGRATSAQTVLQNVAATATPPLFGLAVAGLGFGPGFAVAALFPLAAVAVLHGLTVDDRPPTRPPVGRPDRPARA